MELILEKLLSAMVKIKTTENVMESIGITIEPNISDVNELKLGNLVYGFHDDMVDAIRLLLDLKEDTFDETNNLLMIGCDIEEDIPNTIKELLSLKEEKK